MLKQCLFGFKKFLQIKKSSGSATFKNINTKYFSIPSILLGTFFYFQTRKNISSNRLKLAESFRRLSLQECLDLSEGEMKEVKYGPKDNESILVIKYDGTLRALSNYCPHFGAPMHTGLLIDNVIKCPWHGASFDVLTGLTDIAPSINNLPTYDVLSDENGVYINLPETVQHSVTPKMSKRDGNDTRKFLIIGGGPSGLSAAETLRQSGYTGEILILSKEKYVPYDRTILSKFIPGSINKLYLRTPDFLKEFDIDLLNEVKVNSVDNQNKTVKLEDGREFSYDKLLVASGGSAMIPNIPGITNENVLSLRTFDDLEQIKLKAKIAKNIVIVGGSFIGMESASSLKKAYPEANVIVVERNPTPFYASLGKEIGSALQKMHEEKGVKFILEKNITEIKSDSVILNDNSSYPADLVLLGVGIVPNTQFVKDNLAMNNAFVKTDRYLNTSDENIFAAGDIASVPYFLTGEYISFGHYVSAQQQGAVAALNMLNQRIPYDYVPFFWSRQWDKAIQYTGYGTTWDEVFVQGNLSELKFVAYYIKGDKIVGFASMNSPNAANIMYEAFRNDKLPKANLLKEGSANLESIKQSLRGTKMKCKRADCVCERRRADAQQHNSNDKI